MMPENGETSHFNALRDDVINTLNKIVPKALTDILDKTILEYKQKLRQETLNNLQQHQPEGENRTYAGVTRALSANSNHPNFTAELR